MPLRAQSVSFMQEEAAFILSGFIRVRDDEEEEEELC